MTVSRVDNYPPAAEDSEDWDVLRALYQFRAWPLWEAVGRRVADV